MASRSASHLAVTKRGWVRVLTIQPQIYIDSITDIENSLIINIENHITLSIIYIYVYIIFIQEMDILRY